MMVISSSGWLAEDELTGTFSYCCLLLCYMKGNAANFCGVIFIIEGDVLIVGLHG